MTTRRFSCDFWGQRGKSRSDAAHDHSLVGLQSLDNAELSMPPDVVGAISLAANRTDSAGRPTCLFVPEHYEANYAYPLIVWLHGGGENERDLLNAMPLISQRNYLGLSLRGPLSFRDTATTVDRRRGGYHWPSSDDELSEFETSLYEAVCNLRREYHIHSERIFLAGFDEGATVALDLFLRQPQRYGGAVCLGGTLPKSRHALARFRDLRSKRVLISSGSRDAISTPADNVQASRLLHSAGMSVSTQIVDAGHEVTRTMLRQIDHWIMDGVCAAT
jgi:phospholipase/carboxylesterase